MNVADQIANLFRDDSLLAVNRQGQPVSDDVQQAVAVLLMRAAFTDSRCAPEERETMLQSLCEEFSLDKRDAETLLSEARDLQKFDAWLASFVERIRGSFDVDQRIEVFSLVYKVTIADGLLDAGEDDFLDSLQLKLGLSADEREEAHHRAER